MGIQWLTEIVQILTSAGIPTGEICPGGRWTEPSQPVAAVGLRDLNWRDGAAEFEVRVVSPRALGGWKCQEAAAEAVAALEVEGISCRMEPMAYQSGIDCFEMSVIGLRYVFEEEAEIPVTAGFQILIGTEAVSHVILFSAEQDRERRLIGTLNQSMPVGVTPGTGGWSIRLVQQLPAGAEVIQEPEEPFVLSLKENGLTTVFSGCCWNRLKKSLDADGVRAEWEGFALSREESVDG